MKKTLLAFLIVMSSVTVLSAEGKQDDDVQFYGRGPGMMGGQRFSEEEIAEWQEQREEARAEFLESLETVSISGALTLVNGRLPTIESEGTVFTIMAPWRNLGDIELTDGMEVSVEGYIMPARPLQWDDSEVTIMLTKAVVNGEEIEIEHPAEGAGFRGGFGGHMGQAGKGGRGGSQGRRF